MFDKYRCKFTPSLYNLVLDEGEVADLFDDVDSLVEKYEELKERAAPLETLISEALASAPNDDPDSPEWDHYVSLLSLEAQYREARE